MGSCSVFLRRRTRSPLWRQTSEMAVSCIACSRTCDLTDSFWTCRDAKMPSRGFRTNLLGLEKAHKLMQFRLAVPHVWSLVVPGCYYVTLSTSMQADRRVWKTAFLLVKPRSTFMLVPVLHFVLYFRINPDPSHRNPLRPFPQKEPPEVT